MEYGVVTGAIEEDEQEVYAYGYTLLLETGICIAAMGCIGTLFDMLLEVIIFSIVFIPLRSFGGGIHADCDWKCILLSSAVTVGYCFILRIDWQEYLYSFLLLFNIMGILFVQSKLKSIRYSNIISSKVIVNLICATCILVAVFFLFVSEKYLAKGPMLVIFVWLSSFLANLCFQKNIKNN